MTRFLMLVLVLAMPVEGVPQVRTSARPISTDYAKGVIRGTQMVRPFEDDPRQSFFVLTTSWIPGSDKHGHFRYQIEAAVLDANAAEKAIQVIPPRQGWALSDYVIRAHACSYSLTLYDSEHFVLQRIDPIFQIVVDEASHAKSMRSNDLATMDLHTYQEFLKAKAMDSWDVAWTCD
jgi:hypothetical protein